MQEAIALMEEIVRLAEASDPVFDYTPKIIDAAKSAISILKGSEDVGAQLFKEMVIDAEYELSPQISLPPIDTTIHTDALIAGLQKPAMRLDDST